MDEDRAREMDPEKLQRAMDAVTPGEVAAYVRGAVDVYTGIENKLSEALSLLPQVPTSRSIREARRAIEAAREVVVLLRKMNTHAARRFE